MTEDFDHALSFREVWWTFSIAWISGTAGKTLEKEMHILSALNYDL